MWKGGCGESGEGNEAGKGVGKPGSGVGQWGPRLFLWSESRTQGGQPVLVKLQGGCVPREVDPAVGAVVEVIVFGRQDGQPFGQVAAIFAIECEGLVFQMADGKHLPTHGIGQDAQSRLSSAGEHLDLEGQRLSLHFGVAAVGHRKGYAQALHEGMIGAIDRLREYSEHLCGKWMLRHTMMEVERGLCCPADVECGAGVRGAPRHQAAEVLPIAHGFKRNVFEGSAGDDKTVDGVPEHRAVEVEIVRLDIGLRGGPIGLSGKLDQRKVHLNARCGKHTAEVELGGAFERHEVEHPHVEGSIMVAAGNGQSLCAELMEGRKVGVEIEHSTSAKAREEHGQYRKNGRQALFEEDGARGANRPIKRGHDDAAQEEEAQVAAPHGRVYSKAPRQSSSEKSVVESLIGGHSCRFREEFVGQSTTKDAATGGVPSEHFDVENVKMFKGHDGH